MRLEIEALTLGPLGNNVYMLGDAESGNAVVIDPSYQSDVVLARATELGWTLRQVWLTHAHFDHIAGVGDIANAFNPPLPVGLHPSDLDWFEDDGGARRFGMSIPQLVAPSLLFAHDLQLSLHSGEPPAASVRHAPGHSTGHVMFYCQPLGALFCGDVIFRGGIGRTDLDGGDLDTLLKSIQTQVLSLPDDTCLLPGHGPESTVGHERKDNPYF